MKSVMQDQREKSKVICPYIREADYAVRRPWVIHERRLLDYLVVYIQQGLCKVIVEHQTFLLRPGQFFLIQPDRLVKMEGLTDTTTPFVHFDVFYNSDRESSFPTKQGQLDLSAYLHLVQPTFYDAYHQSIPVVLHPKNPMKLAQLMLSLVEYFQHRDPIFQLKAQSVALDIIIMILEDHLPHDADLHVQSNSLHWMTSYFANNLSSPLQLEDMAKRANLSTSWFNVLFKRTYGMSPYQFLLKMRIDHAKELLATTQHSLEEISAYCGFADIHHFAKTFKLKTGTSPGLYRSSVDKRLEDS